MKLLVCGDDLEFTSSLLSVSSCCTLSFLHSNFTLKSTVVFMSSTTKKVLKTESRIMSDGLLGGGWYTTDQFTHPRNLTSQGSDGDEHSIHKALEHQLFVDALTQRALESAVVKVVAAVPFLSASALALCIGCSISSTDLRERLL